MRKIPPAQKNSMFEKKLISENLQKSYCYKCGGVLSGAKVVPITDAPAAIIAHAVCPACKAESMVTITQAGSGVTPVFSDLYGVEFKKFIMEKPVTYDELLDLHVALEKEGIWNLLHKKEKNLVKKLKK